MGELATAFRNMLKAARRDPLRTVMVILFSPLRVGGYIVLMLLLTVAIFFIVYDLLELLAALLHWQRNFIAQIIIDAAVFVLAGALLWRWSTAPLLRHFGDTESHTHGSARFATPQEMAKLTASLSRAGDMTGAGLLIGRDIKSGKLLQYTGPGHLLTIAPTRSGKGVGTIMPNLLASNRSVICIDPKGENARIAGRARGLFGKVHILDPFGVTGRVSAAFNPLAAFDAASLDVAEDATGLADALVYDPPGEAGEAHWNEEAKALIAGLILYVVVEEPEARRTLAIVRAYLTAAPDEFAALLVRMQASPAAAGLVARAANRQLGKEGREAAGVLSTAQRHTHFLDSPRMAAILSHSDFAFGDLKAGVATVFLVLPPDRLATYARWLRLMVTQSLLDMARVQTKSASPVLYLLDEFAALGRMEPIERAMGLMASYGVQLWPILQDIHQLRAAYGERAGTFLSNAATLQIFAVNDHDTARLVSDLLGQSTIIFETVSQNLDSDRTGISYSGQHVGRPLLTPDEVRNLPQTRSLLFLAGQHPILARKLRYYADAEFKNLFDLV